MSLIPVMPVRVNVFLCSCSTIAITGWICSIQRISIHLPLLVHRGPFCNAVWMRLLQCSPANMENKECREICTKITRLPLAQILEHYWDCHILIPIIAASCRNFSLSSCEALDCRVFTATSMAPAGDCHISLFTVPNWPEPRCSVILKAVYKTTLERCCTTFEVSIHWKGVKLPYMASITNSLHATGTSHGKHIPVPLNVK